jgi:hypothetical protein
MPPAPDYLSDIKKLKGKLLVEVSKSSNSTELKTCDESEQELSMKVKPYKIFVSHSSRDKLYVEKIVELLEDIGLDETQIFCSSVQGYGIPLSENIYDLLRSQFENNNLHVIFVLSENYYHSAASLNEMGAAWVLRNKYTSILLPGFGYKQVEGVIDPRDVALKLDKPDEEVNQHLYELMELLCKEFQIPQPSNAKWERIREQFKCAIKAITDSNVNGG